MVQAVVHYSPISESSFIALADKLPSMPSTVCCSSVSGEQSEH